MRSGEVRSLSTAQIGTVKDIDSIFTVFALIFFVEDIKMKI